MKKEIFLILHNIRSRHNVGAIFRTADAVGVAKIYLTGYTPAPVDKLGLPIKEISKTALGAEKWIPWEKNKNLSPLIKRLQKARVQVVAVEQSSQSTIYSKFKPKYPLALIMGNEVTGLSKSTLKQVDACIEIPMQGKKESLNVSVATGVVLYGIKKP